MKAATAAPLDRCWWQSHDARPPTGLQGLSIRMRDACYHIDGFARARDDTSALYSSIAVGSLLRRSISCCAFHASSLAAFCASDSLNMSKNPERAGAHRRATGGSAGDADGRKARAPAHSTPCRTSLMTAPAENCPAENLFSASLPAAAASARAHALVVAPTERMELTAGAAPHVHWRGRRSPH